MEVLFLRHAHAVDAFGFQDEHRWLSKKGREEALAFGQSLAHRSWTPDQVWTSPKVRAVQTCELVLRALQVPHSAIEAYPDLAYGTTAAGLGCLDRAEEASRVLLVGHEPLIRSMAAQFAQVQLAAFSTATGALVSIEGAKKPACTRLPS